MANASTGTYERLMNPVLVAGCIIILVSFAVRASFGLFQLPIATEFAWPRESFSLAIAIQNLAWGIGQPIFGAFAERYGDRKAILGGGAFTSSAWYSRLTPSLRASTSCWRCWWVSV